MVTITNEVIHWIPGGQLLGSIYKWWIYTGWWLSPTPLKNDGVKVNGKDDIPYMTWKIIKINV